MTKPKMLQNDAKKEKALESAERIIRQRKLSILMLPLSFILSNIVLRNFLRDIALRNLIWVSMAIVLCSIFPSVYFIRRRKESLSADNIYFILAIDFVIELIFLLLIFYLAAPIMMYYFGSVTLIVAPALVLYNILSNPIFNSRKYSTFFFLFSCLFLALFSLLEYFNLYPLSAFNFPVKLGEPRIIMASFSIGLTFLAFIQLYVDNFWEMFRRQAKELETLNEELEQRVQERTSQLEEAKSILEIKVKARTKELEELTQGLDRKVRERTQELQKKVDELEKFHQLTVGRELKMIELKKAIEKLESEGKLKKE